MTELPLIFEIGFVVGLVLTFVSGLRISRRPMNRL